MGRDQHRAVVKAGQGFYQIADFVDTGRVKAVGGFVQNQDRRTPQQRPGKEDYAELGIIRLMTR